jgi:hypothetical protein
MGSDWMWELRLHEVAPEHSLRRLYELAAARDLHPQRPDGLINLFNHDGEHRTVANLDTALAAMATGTETGQLWTNSDVDIFLGLEDGRLHWVLDAVWCRREPVPEADAFRQLHHRLTDLWLDVAQALNATCGRVFDEWSTEQVHHLGIHNAIHPVGAWPAELGWQTYLGPNQHRPPPPLAQPESRTRRLPNGALHVTLLDDPTAVDEANYENIHKRWIQAP